MRTTKVTQSAAGATQWVPIEKEMTSFSLTIGCVCSSNINATYKVQYTHDDIWLQQDCFITRAAAVATLTLVNHGLTTADSIVVQGTNDTNLDGTYTVASVVDQNTITYAVANTGSLVSNGRVCVLRVFDHPVITGKTANSDGNIAFPVRAVRLNITAYTAGYVTMILNQGATGD